VSVAGKSSTCPESVRYEIRSKRKIPSDKCAVRATRGSGRGKHKKTCMFTDTSHRTCKEWI
ncbi:hypothetical protein Csa_013099, partial [Cucumis sativus]